MSASSVRQLRRSAGAVPKLIAEDANRNTPGHKRQRFEEALASARSARPPPDSKTSPISGSSSRIVPLDADGQDNLQASGPQGASLAKQAYEDEAGTTKKNLTVMERDEDGWFMASWDPSGNLVTAGVEPAGCWDCHSAGQDGVIASTW